MAVDKELFNPIFFIGPFFKNFMIFFKNFFVGELSTPGTASSQLSSLFYRMFGVRISDLR